jgi:hypothetical protein
VEAANSARKGSVWRQQKEPHVAMEITVAVKTVFPWTLMTIVEYVALNVARVDFAKQKKGQHLAIATLAASPTASRFCKAIMQDAC